MFVNLDLKLKKKYVELLIIQKSFSIYYLRKAEFLQKFIILELIKVELCKHQFLYILYILNYEEKENMNYV